MLGIFAGIAAEFFQKCPLVAVHAAKPKGKGGVDDAAILLLELHGGFRQPKPADIFGGRYTDVELEQPIGMPW